MKLFLMLLIFSTIPLFAQYKAEADSLIDLVMRSETGSTRKQEERLITILYISDYNSGKLISKKLLNLSSSLKDKELYIEALIHSWRYHTFEEKIEMLNKAYDLAVQDGNKLLAGAALVFKATAFRDNSMTDSAMICCLRARDIYENSGYKEELISVLNLIADLHYYAGQYDKAEILYKQILDNKHLKPDNWRYYTITNNIGLIRVRQQRYAEAEKYFMVTYNHLIAERQKNNADSSALPYIYRKLLEVSLLQNHYTKAVEFYNKSIDISEKLNVFSELPGVYAAKGELCFIQGKFDSALVFFKRAQELNLNYPDLRNEISIFDGFAKTYSALNDLKNANSYMKLLRLSERKSDSIYHRARYMNIFAEYNYNNSLLQVENYKKEKNFLLVILAVGSISFVTILLFFYRLKRLNRKLVEKNLEIAFAGRHDSHLIPVEQEYLEQGLSENNFIESSNEDVAKKSISGDILHEISERLNTLLLDEKVYLKPDLTINELSEKLNTNRTYLSKAIIESKNQNFISYINSLRIKEAIRIISEGEHKNLSIDGIAQKAGFNNRVSFTKAFQKYAGVTPSFFIKNLDILPGE